MKQWARRCAFLLCTFFALLTAAQNSNLVFLESTDAKGAFDRRQMAACEAQFIQELNLAGRELPNILVVHVSEKAGAVAGVHKTSLRRNSGKGAEGVPTYYELWLVGQVNPADYVAALENILELHFQLNLSDQRRHEVLTRIARYVKNTVSAYSGE